MRTLALSGMLERTSKELGSSEIPTIPVVFCGPYGTTLLPAAASSAEEVTNILAVAGGTGVSLTLPVVLAATLSPTFDGAAIDFIWIIRRSSSISWISAELNELKRRSSMNRHLNINIHIYVTQEDGTKGTTLPQANSLGEDKAIDIEIEPLTEADSSSSRSEVDSRNLNFKVSYLNSRHPSLQNIVSEFIETRASFDYRTRVIASGPSGIGHDLRAAVAELNDGNKVWKGQWKFDIDLHWDDRMG